MAHVICKHPMVRLDLRVKKQHWPKLASMIGRCQCHYEAEFESKVDSTGEEWITLKDVQSLRGDQLGNLIGLFYSMEWDSVTEGKEDKFYIMLNMKKREKKYDHEHREKVGPGCESRNSGKSAGDIRFGPNSGLGGNGDRACVVDADDLRGLPVLESADDDCE